MTIVCPSGKRSYATKGKALAVSGRPVKKIRVLGIRLMPYQCGHCGRWHLVTRRGSYDWQREKQLTRPAPTSAKRHSRNR